MAVAKKKFAAKNKEVNVMIKVKDEEGKIVEFASDEAAVTIQKKKKKILKT